MNIAELAEERRIFTMRAGSHSYGLNTATSDEDFRGVFIGTPDNLLGLYPVEHCEYNGDYMVYELKKFVLLARDCNPNIIELLYVDESDVVLSTPWWDRLRENRKLFLTRKAKWTFSGYATAQLKKIRGHKQWLSNPQAVEPPQPAKYIKTKYIEGLGQHEVFDQQAYDDAHRKWKQYWEWKQNRNPKRAALEEDFGFDCYSSDTEFLTEKGWRHYDDIQGDERLATVFLNRSHHAMEHRRSFGVEYQKATERFDGQFNGRLYHFFGHHTDVLVTPNHRMLYRKVERRSGFEYQWDLEEASCIPDTFDFLSTIAPRTASFSHGQLFEDLPIPPASYLTLMGWYLSDGCLNLSPSGKPKCCRISQKKGGKLSWSMARFRSDHQNSIRGSLYEYERAPNAFNSTTITERVLDIRQPEIINRIYIDCGRGNKKRIPRWAFGLSKRLMERLFDALIRGDGTIRQSTPDKSVIYYSSSRNLADDVQELAFHCGWETSLWGPFSNDREGIGCPLYHVHVNKLASQTRQLIRNQNLKLLPVENQRIVCFTVPNGTLVTRRNGRIGIHGNSKHAMHLVRLLRMGSEILRGEGVIVKRPDRDELLAIRNGEWSFERIIAYSDEIIAQMDGLYEKAPLPHAPDVRAINELMLGIYRDYWHTQGEF